MEAWTQPVKKEENQYGEEMVSEKLSGELLEKDSEVKL